MGRRRRRVRGVLTIWTKRRLAREWGKAHGYRSNGLREKAIGVLDQKGKRAARSWAHLFDRFRDEIARDLKLAPELFRNEVRRVAAKAVPAAVTEQATAVQPSRRRGRKFPLAVKVVPANSVSVRLGSAERALRETASALVAEADRIRNAREAIAGI